jgi:predicted signal transduction protein with EAL and GGDEF domain
MAHAQAGRNQSHALPKGIEVMTTMLLYAIAVVALTQVRVAQRWLLVGLVTVIMIAVTTAS